MKLFYKSLFVYHYNEIAFDVFVAKRRRPASSEISCVPTEWTAVAENAPCDMVL
jgi:hypothetical protein